ncbi:MAG: type VI secretion system ATPase TssH [Planctomycetota bacterium]
MVAVDLKALIGRLNRLSTRSLEAAAGLCISRSNYEVSVEHVLLKLLEDASADIPLILKHFELDAGRLSKSVLATIEEFRTGNSGKPVFSPILMDWFRDAWVVASIDQGEQEIRSGALFRALLDNPSRFAAGDYLEALEGISRETLRKSFHDIVAASSESVARKEARAAAAAERGADTALAKFAIDFTARAKEGAIDPVFGRDREIRQVVDILARRRKNNPIVVGEAGVGKTAVVEGLALRVVEGDVPDVLKNVAILSLDMGLLQAGAGVKGEFENRLKAVIDEVKSSLKPVVLFIDEAHTLIGAGGAAGGSDAANLLKPALARGELRTIAATTWSEYKKYFEKDAALARRFQVVKLDEPSDDAAVTMLRGLRDRYETAHGVLIRDDALVAAASLGSRYISGRQHPDKGVDLVDTTAARVKVALSSKPDVLQDLERKIQTLERELHAHRRDVANGTRSGEGRIPELEGEIDRCRTEARAMAERWQKEKQAVDRVLELRKQLLETSAPPAAPPAAKDKDKDKAAGHEPRADKSIRPGGPGRAALQAELDAALAAMRELQGKNPLVPLEVDPEIVAKVVSDWTGIPVGKMVRDEAESLLKFEENLRRRIKGQDHVLEIIARGVRAAKAGLKSPRTPMGVFLFVGPSGVGKTECALAVADLLFGGERFMTTINMSEFQEKHTVSRLIGSPPGYVGYGEGGVLTEAVRQRPYSVVLLDEVEKADPEVLNLFYQVFDKGMLADGEGRVIDFKDTVIFLTSNLASDLIMASSTDAGRPPVDQLTGLIRPVLSRHFKPALLARMTIAPFYPIDAEAMKQIVALKLGQLKSRLLESHRMTLEHDLKVNEAIASRCTEVETGARNVDHILSGTLLPRISTEILKQMSIGPLPDRLTVGLDDAGDFTFQFGRRTEPAAK